MNKMSDKFLYRIIAQTEGVTTTAETVGEVTMQEAMELGKRSVLVPNVEYKNFIVQPISTSHGWKYGHINFCPRCGNNISEEMGDSRHGANNVQEFECPECYAEVFVDIRRTPEEREDPE